MNIKTGFTVAYRTEDDNDWVVGSGVVHAFFQDALEDKREADRECSSSIYCDLKVVEVDYNRNIIKA